MDGSQFSDSLTSLVEKMDAPRQYHGTAATVQQADAAFVDSAWYGKILTIPVDDAVREWRSWQAKAEQIEKLEAEEKRLGYQMVVRDALIGKRHQGGVAILPIGLPGANGSPLNLDAIREGSIKRFVVLGPEEIRPGAIIRDPLSEGYGKPEYWEVGQSPVIRLHPSRVFLINGRTAPGSAVRRSHIWGDPIWSHLQSSIMASDAAAGIVSALLNEAKIDVVSIPELTEMLLTKEGEEAMMRRWNAVARLKKVGNVLLIDGGPSAEGTKSEEWDQKTMTWGGLPDTVKTLLMIMAGAADIPVTRLTGEQQTGLSGADTGSLKHYYDMVASRQKLDIEPDIAGLDEILIRSALGQRDPKVWFRWNSLYQMDEKTAAEVDKLHAETASVYARDALVPSEALEKAAQARMVETGRWPGLEAALKAAPKDEDDAGDDLRVTGEGDDPDPAA